VTDPQLDPRSYQPGGIASPQSRFRIAGWARANLFNTWWNALLTLIVALLIWAVCWPLVKFVLIDAAWQGADRDDCLASQLGREVGACWPFVHAKMGQFLYGFYPIEERWRVDVTAVLGLGLLVPLLIPSLPYKRANSLLFFLAYPLVGFVLLVGGVFGLEHVETRVWGGLLVTLVIAVTGIVGSLPLGIVLALGRRSELPVVRAVSVMFIEFWRGVPLITVLFFATYMLPLFVPAGWVVNPLLRVMIGVMLFAAAYMAEVVRGGLQAIPKAQYEAAQALGLGYWRTMALIILPQALKLVIPGIVNTFIGLFKDTTLVLIISIFDLLGQLRASFSDPNWATPTTVATGFAFAGIVYFCFCFGMSRYALWMERRLNPANR
jgi:general L-amino acid transport system permease protein